VRHDCPAEIRQERPILLEQLYRCSSRDADGRLQFIKDEGINIVIQLDIKEEEVLELSYNIISRFTNSSGVPALGASYQQGAHT
jgi:hypothetical protein